MKLSSNVVLLGNSGFLGKAINDYLLGIIGQGPLFGYSSSMIDLTVNESLETLNDIVDRDTVLVVVSAITPERVKADSLSNFESNVSMIINLAGFLEKHPVGKCVYLSTASVYSTETTNLKVNEDTAIAPGSYYGAAKFTGECILRVLSARANIPLLVLRPCRIYGPGDQHSEYGPVNFVRAIVEERSVFLYGDGTELRDHLLLSDFLELLCHLSFNDSCGIYNLATGDSRPYSEIIEHLRHIVPIDFEVSHAPRTRPTVDQAFDISKLAAAAPDHRFTELRQGLQETYEAFATTMGRSTILD